MKADQALLKIKNILADIHSDNLTATEKRIKKIVDKHYKCICNPKSHYMTLGCPATEHK